MLNTSSFVLELTEHNHFQSWILSELTQLFPFILSWICCSWCDCFRLFYLFNIETTYIHSDDKI